MSDELPSVSGTQVINAFERIGFRVARVKGSHHIMRREATRFVLTVPVHGNKPVSVGVLRSLIRTAEISVKEFVKLLNQ